MNKIQGGRLENWLSVFEGRKMFLKYAKHNKMKKEWKFLLREKNVANWYEKKKKTTDSLFAEWNCKYLNQIWNITFI